MKPVIELQHVTKSYGQSRGVVDLQLAVQPGTVFGFLGPNGAGKSTTINMLIDFIRPTSGVIRIFGLDSVKDSIEIRRRIGFLAGDFALDRGLSGWQQVEYFGQLRGGFDRKYVKELAARLDCNLHKKFKTLSRGNKQKVGLITALMHKPDLLIFDEPTSGLDPLIQAEFNKIILEQKQRGATTFISSHVLSEVQELCDRVAFIRDGKIVADRPMADLAAAAREVQIKETGNVVAKKLRNFDGVSHLHTKAGFTQFMYGGDINKLVALLAGQKLIELTIGEPNIEAIFMQYYEDKDA